jgi:dihydroorotase
MQVYIHKALVIDESSAWNGQTVDITIENGTITHVKAVKSQKSTPYIKEGDTIIWKDETGDGLQVSPGWVDMLADYREPGQEHKENLASGLNAAQAGGFTHVLHSPNTQPTASGKSVIQYLLQQSKDHAVNLLPIGTASQQAEGKELAEMLDMQANGAQAFSDGWKPIQNANLMLKALEYIKALDQVLIQIPIDNSLAAGGLMHEGEVSTALGMPGIPPLAEMLMVYRDIELLRYTQSKLHLTGITTAASVAMIRKAKADGLNITCSVTPYHLLLTDDAMRTYDSKYKVLPPLRPEADRKALINGLIDGTIDAIASHHRPHDWDAKTKEFEYAADGMAIQEVTYPMCLKASKKLTDAHLVRALSTQPRRILGLPAAGVSVGLVASLTFFNHSQWACTEENKQSQAYNNPFINTTFMGKVIGILNNNQIKINQ